MSQDLYTEWVDEQLRAGATPQAVAAGLAARFPDISREDGAAVVRALGRRAAPAAEGVRMRAMAPGPMAPPVTPDDLVDDAAFQASLYRLAFPNDGPPLVAGLVRGWYPTFGATQVARVLRFGPPSPVFPQLAALDLGRVLLGPGQFPGLDRAAMAAALTAAGCPDGDVAAALGVLYPGAPVPAYPPTLGFDGATSQVTIAHRDAYNFGTRQDFTVELWILAPATQRDLRSWDNNILEKWTDDVGPARRGYPFVVRIVNQNGGADAGKVIVGRYDTVNNPTIRSTMPLNDGRFHHIAFVKAGTQLQLYVDGRLNGTTNDTCTLDTTSAAPMTVATRGGGGWRNFFLGRVSELRLWNGARTAAQIEGAMRTPLAGNEPGLVGYWRLREGAGTVAQDGSPGANAGTIAAPQWGLAPWYPLVQRVGPAGTQGPQPFDDTDAALALGQPLTMLRVRAGDIIDGVQAFYGPARQALPLRGGGGGNQIDVPIDPNDPVVQVSGFTGSWYGRPGLLLQLTLTLRSGRVLGPFGTMGGANVRTPFTLAGPGREPVLALLGSANSGLMGSLGITVVRG